MPCNEHGDGEQREALRTHRPVPPWTPSHGPCGGSVGAAPARPLPPPESPQEWSHIPRRASVVRREVAQLDGREVSREGHRPRQWQGLRTPHLVTESTHPRLLREADYEARRRAAHARHARHPPHKLVRPCRRGDNRCVVEYGNAVGQATGATGAGRSGGGDVGAAIGSSLDGMLHSASAAIGVPPTALLAVVVVFLLLVLYLKFAR